MDYAEALAAITGSDLATKDQIIAAIKGQVATVIGEKRQVTEKLTGMETAMTAIVEGTKATGESVAEQAKDAAAKIKALTDALAEKEQAITTLTTEKTALETEKTALANKAKLQEIATKVNANPTVLGTLVPDPSKITVDGDAIKVDGVAWDDWLKSEAVAPFAPALITTEAKPKQPSLPKTSASSESPATGIYESIRPKPYIPGAKPAA